MVQIGITRSVDDERARTAPPASRSSYQARRGCAKRLTIARAGHGLNAAVLGVRKQEQHDG